MREIELTQGKSAMVDNIDYEFLSQFKWCADKQGDGFRAKRNIPKDGKQTGLMMHRAIAERMGIDSPSIDHINRDQLDNRRCNLRAATGTQQQHNKGKQSNNTSGLPGVWRDRARDKWLSQIEHQKERYFLGYFDDPRQAFLVYACKKLELAGEFTPSEIQTLLDGFTPLEVVTFMATHATSDRVDIRYLLNAYA